MVTAVQGFSDAELGADVDNPDADVVLVFGLADLIGRKFEVADLDMAMYEAAERYVRAYRGDFPYLADLAARYRRGGGLTDGQAKGVLNCMAAEGRRRQRETETARYADLDREVAQAEAYERFVASQARPAAHPAAATLANVPNATYTVVFADDEDYVTVRLSDWRSKGDGTRIVAFLNGPCNGTDYQGFATVDPTGAAQVWGKYRRDGRLAQALAVLAGSGAEDQEGMRQGYAMLSGRCAKCGRTLTVPASLHRGLGPECAKGF